MSNLGHQAEFVDNEKSILSLGFLSGDADLKNALRACTHVSPMNVRDWRLFFPSIGLQLRDLKIGLVSLFVVFQCLGGLKLGSHHLPTQLLSKFQSFIQRHRAFWISYLVTFVRWRSMKSERASSVCSIKGSPACTMQFGLRLQTVYLLHLAIEIPTSCMSRLCCGLHPPQTYWEPNASMILLLSASIAPPQ